MKGDTIEEGDAKAHEQCDDDETKTGAEGVYECEPVNSTLRTHTQHIKMQAQLSFHTQ